MANNPLLLGLCIILGFAVTMIVIEYHRGKPIKILWAIIGLAVLAILGSASYYDEKDGPLLVPAHKVSDRC